MKNFHEHVQDYLQFMIDEKINLRIYAQMNKLPVYGENSQDKGWKGLVIEHMLNLNQNNKKGSDYETLEIKTVPISVKKHKVLETTCLSVLKPEDIIKHNFLESDVYHKIKKTLFVLINVDDKHNPFIHQTVYFDLDSHLLLREQMQEDYNDLSHHILDNIENDYALDTHFTGKLGSVMQPRPKTGKRGDYIWAFYLKTSVLNTLFFPSTKKKNKP